MMAKRGEEKLLHVKMMAKRGEEKLLHVKMMKRGGGGGAKRNCYMLR